MQFEDKSDVENSNTFRGSIRQIQRGIKTVRVVGKQLLFNPRRLLFRNGGYQIVRYINFSQEKRIYFYVKSPNFTFWHFNVNIKNT